MDDAEITTTPEHLLDKDLTSLSKKESSSVLRGLLAYELRAAPHTEHSFLHKYYDRLRLARRKLADHYISLGGEVAPIVLMDALPAWSRDEYPPIATLVKTKGRNLHNA